MTTLEKFVDAGFRALLLCSAMYVGAEYSPYVLRVADKIKNRIIPGSSMHNFKSSTSNQKALQPCGPIMPPLSLANSDPRLYNAILIEEYVSANNSAYGAVPSRNYNQSQSHIQSQYDQQTDDGANTNGD